MKAILFAVALFAPAGVRPAHPLFSLEESAENRPETTREDRIGKEQKQRVASPEAKGNPYYQSVYERLGGTKPEPRLPKEIPSSWTFSGLTTRALACAWGASFDESPLKGDDALIAHAVGLIDFCLQQQKDGSWFYSRKWQSRADPNSDRFALGPLMDAIYWLRRLPDMDKHWQRWETPLKALVEFQYKNWGHYKDNGLTDSIAWGSSAFTYPNQDVFHLYEMALAYQFWGDDKYQADVQATLDGLENHRLPNGGLNYIGSETEIPTYHDLNVVWLARYHALTGDNRAKKLLAATTPYYPSVCSNEGRPECYTDCWWKHITDSVIVRDMAALGARYTIHRPYINSVAGRDVPPTPWQATQVWLLTKHGLVGLLEVEATEELTVPHLGAEVRLGPGMPIEHTANGSYRVGPLVTRILDTNLSEVTVGKARPPYAQSESKHEAIRLRTGGDEHTARPGEPLYYAVLAGPQDATQIKSFRRLDKEGVWAFQVSIDGKPVVVSFNAVDKAVRLELVRRKADRQGGSDQTPSAANHD